MIVRQSNPELEIAALDDEVTEVLEELRKHFTTLLDFAYDVRVMGKAPNDLWSQLDVALRAFTFASAHEVAESIAAFIDRDQEALLAALAPAEDSDYDREVWRAARIADVAAVEGYHKGLESEARAFVTPNREWRIAMLSHVSTDGPRVVNGRSRLVRHAVAQALGMTPHDAPVQAIELEVLTAARALASGEQECPSCGAAVDEGCRQGPGPTGDPLTSCG